jgi:hypothetical protein
MATQIVMDRTGDTRHNFDAQNADAILKAEERFMELTGAGFTATARAASTSTATMTNDQKAFGLSSRKDSALTVMVATSTTIVTI